MSSTNGTTNTIKGHGLAVGDRFNFHGMASDLPTDAGTRVELSKVGTKYILTSVMGDVLTWEFGPTAKIHANTTVKHAVIVAARDMSNGDVVYLAQCEHGYGTGFHTSADDAEAVALGHGEVSRPLYVAPAAVESPAVESAEVPAWLKLSAEAGDDITDPAVIRYAGIVAARELVKVNARVFVAEVANFADTVPVGAWAEAVEEGTLTLIVDPDTGADGGMSRYVRTMRTADGVKITDGLAVWDYNLNPGTIALASLDTGGWFDVYSPDGARSYMNAERVGTRHPHTRQMAAEVLAGPSLGAIADDLAASDRRHVEALAAEQSPADVEIHMGGHVITVDDVKARLRAAFGDAAVEYPVDYIAEQPSLSLGEVLGAEFHAVMDRAESDVIPPCCTECVWDAIEREAWAGTGTLLKRPVRTLVNRRKRKATKVNARRVRGGF